MQLNDSENSKHRATENAFAKENLFAELASAFTPESASAFAPESAPLMPAPKSEVSNPLTFTGVGSEYFGIWITNLMLSIITLGIYSAWAKVRRLQYFYRNTHLASASFDFHGDAKRIFKGRAIIFVLFAASNILDKYSLLLGGIASIVIFLVFPWLLYKSFRFKLFNSSYRGLRFHFRGGIPQSFKVFALFPILSVLTAGLLFPFAHQRIKEYQHDKASFGQSQFSFHGKISEFYKVYLKTFLMLCLPAGLILGVVFAIFSGALMDIFELGVEDLSESGSYATQAVLGLFILAGLLLVFFTASIFIRPYFNARMQNLVWNNTTLGEGESAHHFVSNVKARQLFFIMFTNFLLVIITLGFYRPFAVIRLMKYQIESVSMISQGSLDEFAAQEGAAVSALGDEAADMFDVDFAL